MTAPEQLHLDISTQPLVAAEGDTIRARFESFHARNPWVYDALEKLTRDYLAAGAKRIGIGMLTEVLRWHYGRATDGDQFRLNNSYRSHYVRLLLQQHPEWQGRFETRELRAA